MVWPFSRKTKNVQAVMLEGGTWVRIAGVMHYQDTIEQLAGGRKKEDMRIETVAALVREPNNPHDYDAVTVQIDGKIVGHLPRDTAEEYQPFLQRLENDKKVAGCEALILGGQKKGLLREQHDFGIRLRLPDSPS